MARPYLGNPKYTIEVLQKYHFVFQKRFGQNFLIDEHVLEKIIESSGITKDDFILEIGPGIGTMTQYLAEAAREVAAVEIDSSLIPILKDTLKDWDNVSVINNDILKTDIKKIADEKNGGKPVKVVANLPYYITTPIIMGLFEKNVPVIRSLSWCRRRLQTVCRLVPVPRITVRFPWLCSIMRSRRSLRMYRRIVLCRGRRLEVR